MHIYFSVGDPSGDLHASKLVRELLRRAPGARCTGLGGPLMQSAGCEVHYRLTDLAVMGVVDVLPLLARFHMLLREARAHLALSRPDALVLVDYPGFNWWMARAARRLGIPVIYYMPPQLWAWAPWRVRKMRRLVDMALCGLPFEAEWYQKRGVPARLAGHPFFDEVAERQLDGTFLRGRAGAGPTVALLPGSRGHEIKLNFNTQLQVAQRVRQRVPHARFLAGCYRQGQLEECQARLRDSGLNLPIEFHVGRTSEIIALADVCLMVSGSVSLEVLARAKPAVVLYRVGRIHHFLGKLLINCPFITLPNLVAGRPLLPEFVITGAAQKQTAQMADLLATWLTDQSAAGSLRAQLAELRERVARPGATSAAVQAILEFLHASGGQPGALAPAA